MSHFKGPSIVLYPRYCFLFLPSYMKRHYCWSSNNVSFIPFLGQFVHFFLCKKLKAQVSQEIKRTYCRDILVSSSLLSVMNHLHQILHNPMPKQYLWPFTIHVSYLVFHIYAQQFRQASMNTNFQKYLFI